MSIASLVRRGYADSVASIMRWGFSAPGAGPTLLGDAGPIRLVLNRPAVAYDMSVLFSGTGNSYSIAPATHANGSFNTGTCVLTWDPLTLGDFGPYTITATNSSGSVSTSAFTVTVQATAPKFSLFDVGLAFRVRVGF